MGLIFAGIVFSTFGLACLIGLAVALYRKARNEGLSHAVAIHYLRGKVDLDGRYYDDPRFDVVQIPANEA